MPLPSLFISRKDAQAWSIPRAGAYGAGIGALAALFKVLEPLHERASVVAGLAEIAGAALAFALLCAGAAALRNAIARRLIWPEMR